MQFGLAGSIIRLNEKSSAFAVGNNASETCLEAGPGSGHYNGADLAGHLQALVTITLGGNYLLRVEEKVLHGSVIGCEHATLFFFDIDLPLDQKARQPVEVENEIDLRRCWVLNKRIHRDDLPCLLQKQNIF